jgi:hypothetical protein
LTLDGVSVQSSKGKRYDYAARTEKGNTARKGRNDFYSMLCDMYVRMAETPAGMVHSLGMTLRAEPSRHA